MVSRLLRLLRSVACGGALTLAACAAPVFKDAPASVATPIEVAAQPERYHGADVVWGGKILAVRNLADTTEVQVVAYPLDRAQRPDQNAPTHGRFIIALPGYVEPLDYPAGRFVTLRGRVARSRASRVDDRDMVFPLVADATVHLWPANFPYERPRVSFGIGVGIGIH
jgi:outer membrane lipoprotein